MNNLSPYSPSMARDSHASETDLEHFLKDPPELKHVLRVPSQNGRSVTQHDIQRILRHSETKSKHKSDWLQKRLVYRNPDSVSSIAIPKTPKNGKLTLTPERFHDLLKANQLDEDVHYTITGSLSFFDDPYPNLALPKKLTINGDLTILHCKNVKLPNQLVVQGVCLLTYVGFKKLPDSFKVVTRLSIDSCHGFTELPKELEVRRLEISYCDQFAKLAAGLSVKNINIEECKNFNTIEAGIKVPDSLLIISCPNLHQLPERLTVGHCLFVQECTALKALPKTISVKSGLFLNGCSALETLPEGLELAWGLELDDCTALRSLPLAISLGGKLSLKGCSKIRTIPDWVTRLGLDKDGSTRDIYLQGTGLSEGLIAQLQSMDTLGINFHLPNVKEDYKDYFFDLRAEKNQRNLKIRLVDDESSLFSRLMRNLIYIGNSSKSASKTGRQFIFNRSRIVEMESNNGDRFLMFRSTGTACKATEGCWVPFPGVLDSDHYQDWLIKGWNEGDYQYSYEDMKQHQYHSPFFQKVAIELSEEEHILFPELPDKSTRKDKHKEHTPFTTVKAESTDGQPFTAELLNTLPGQVLKNMYNSTWVDSLPERKKKTPLSQAAYDSLTHGHVIRTKSEYNSTQNNNAKYIGQSMSQVKFARLTPPWSGKPTICAAKKIKGLHLQTSRLITTEAIMQKKSGCAPKVYGVAKTVTQKGEAQRILFMDIAKGENAMQFLQKNKNTLTEPQKALLAKNYAIAVQSMHKRGVYHGDLKPANSFINSDMSIELIDFGFASGLTKTLTGASFNKSAAPELSHPRNLWTGKTTVDMDKVDVFSLGYIMSAILGSRTFAEGQSETHWRTDTTTQELEAYINDEFASITFSQPDIGSFIQKMMTANPERRPGMEEVVNVISSWHYHLLPYHCIM